MDIKRANIILATSVSVRRSTLAEPSMETARATFHRTLDSAGQRHRAQMGYRVCPAAVGFAAIVRACRYSVANVIFCTESYLTLSGLGFWDWLDSNYHKFKILSLEDCPFIVDMQTGYGRIIIVDVRNYTRKLKIETTYDDTGGRDHAARCSGQGMSIADWAGRCLDEVAQLVRSLISLVSDGTVLSWGLTAGSMSMSDFLSRSRIKVVKESINGDGELVGRATSRPCYRSVDPASEESVAEADALRGGYCQCFRVGPVSGPVYHLDANSLYPSVMSAYPYPVCHHLTTSEPGQLGARNQLAGRCGIADVLIRSMERSYPATLNGSTAEAIGEFWTTLCGNELKHALQCDHVVSIGRLITYNAEYIFSDWVDKLYARRLALRASGDMGGSGVINLILQSLHGKFSQRERVWLDRPGHPARGGPYGYWRRAAVDGSTGHFRSVSWLTQEQVDGGYSRHSWPAIGAIIAANARFAIRTLLDIAGPDECYYSDTDSIHCSELGYTRLYDAGRVDPDRIGSLKIVGVHNSAHYYGVKDYVLDGTLVRAGLDQHAAPSGPDAFRVVRRAGWRYDFAAGSPGSASERVEDYHAGRLGATGRVTREGRVIPWVLRPISHTFKINGVDNDKMLALRM